MPHRFELISHLIEVVFYNICNVIILISLMNVFSAIPIIISIIYGYGRIKRDVHKYHNGKFKDYWYFLIDKAKKN